jgi:hypothetical protein
LQFENSAGILGSRHGGKPLWATLSSEGREGKYDMTQTTVIHGKGMESLESFFNLLNSALHNDQFLELEFFNAFIGHDGMENPDCLLGITIPFEAEATLRLTNNFHDSDSSFNHGYIDYKPGNSKNTLWDVIDIVNHLLQASPRWVKFNVKYQSETN